MTTSILKEDGEKYGGKYVAIRSFKSSAVICSGINPSRVLSCAKKKVKNPVIFYVPKKGMVQIY